MDVLHVLFLHFAFVLHVSFCRLVRLVCLSAHSCCCFLHVSACWKLPRTFFPKFFRQKYEESTEI